MRSRFHTAALALLVNTKVEQFEAAHDPLASQSTGSSAQHSCLSTSLIDDVTTQVEHKRKHVTALRSPLMKTLDRSVETLGREL